MLSAIVESGMSPRGLYVKDLGPSTTGRGGTFKRRGLVGGSSVITGPLLKGY